MDGATPCWREVIEEDNLVEWLCAVEAEALPFSLYTVITDSAATSPMPPEALSPFRGAGSPLANF